MSLKILISIEFLKFWREKNVSQSTYLLKLLMGMLNSMDLFWK